MKQLEKMMNIFKTKSKPQNFICKSSVVVFDLKCIIKAGIDAKGERIVELEASNEQVDLEGDVILQKALLDSADTFIRDGHLDIDHLSEIGDTLDPPIADPLSYIVGIPTKVTDLGGGRTGVTCQITKSADGTVNTERNKYDMLWESLNRKPPVAWRASIFGYPKLDEIVDCSATSCSHGATRYLVKGIDWRSLAFTRTPMNNKITGFATIVSAKSYSNIMKAGGYWPVEGDIFTQGDEPILSSMVGGTNGVPGVGGTAIAEGSDYGYSGASSLDATVYPIAGSDALNIPVNPNCPNNTDEMWGEYLRHIIHDCPINSYLDGNTVGFFREHYMLCRGLPFDKADILAHAMAFMVLSRGK